MKRTIAMVMMAMFVLTQTGISYALRTQETIEATKGGNTKGIVTDLQASQAPAPAAGITGSKLASETSQTPLVEKTADATSLAILKGLQVRGVKSVHQGTDFVDIETAIGLVRNQGWLYVNGTLKAPISGGIGFGSNSMWYRSHGDLSDDDETSAPAPALAALDLSILIDAANEYFSNNQYWVDLRKNGIYDHSGSYTVELRFAETEDLIVRDMGKTYGVVLGIPHNAVFLYARGFVSYILGRIDVQDITNQMTKEFIAKTENSQYAIVPNPRTGFNKEKEYSELSKYVEDYVDKHATAPEAEHAADMAGAAGMNTVQAFGYIQEFVDKMVPRHNKAFVYFENHIPGLIDSLTFSRFDFSEGHTPTAEEIGTALRNVAQWNPNEKVFIRTHYQNIFVFTSDETMNEFVSPAATPISIIVPLTQAEEGVKAGAIKYIADLSDESRAEFKSVFETYQLVEKDKAIPILRSWLRTYKDINPELVGYMAENISEVLDMLNAATPAPSTSSGQAPAAGIIDEARRLVEVKNLVIILTGIQYTALDPDKDPIAVRAKELRNALSASAPTQEIINEGKGFVEVVELFNKLKGIKEIALSSGIDARVKNAEMFITALNVPTPLQTDVDEARSFIEINELVNELLGIQYTALDPDKDPIAVRAKELAVALEDMLSPAQETLGQAIQAMAAVAEPVDTTILVFTNEDKGLIALAELIRLTKLVNRPVVILNDEQMNVIRNRDDSEIKHMFQVIVDQYDTNNLTLCTTLNSIVNFLPTVQLLKSGSLRGIDVQIYSSVISNEIASHLEKLGIRVANSEVAKKAYDLVTQAAGTGL